MVFGGRIHIHVAEQIGGRLSVVEHRIVNAAGGPLPIWLERQSRDFYAGLVPATGGFLDLRIEATLQDGSRATRMIRIELSTGAVSRLPSDPQASAPRTFTEALLQSAPSSLAAETNTHRMLAALRAL
jgi:hypothetical protein